MDDCIVQFATLGYLATLLYIQMDEESVAATLEQMVMDMNGNDRLGQALLPHLRVVCKNMGMTLVGGDDDTGKH
jgi:hypothetical protein